MSDHLHRLVRLAPSIASTARSATLRAVVNLIPVTLKKPRAAVAAVIQDHLACREVQVPGVRNAEFREYAADVSQRQVYRWNRAIDTPDKREQLASVTEGS